jgi:hypothetical protein
MSLTKVKGIVWEANENDLPYSVKDFGAKGDGTTDDTVAIQAAIDAVELAGGGTVYFPNGVYIVSNTITVDEPGVKLQGDSRGTTEPFSKTNAPVGSTIKLDDGAYTSASKAILELTYTASYSGIPKMGHVVRDLTIYGNRADGTGTSNNPNAGDATNNNTYGIGINVVGTRDIYLDNVSIQQCAEEGILVQTGGPDNTSAGVVITNCWVVGNSDHGIHYSGGDSLISNCQVGFNAGSGIYMNGGGTVSGCGCWDNYSTGMSILNDDVVVNGGIFYDNKLAGIRVSGAYIRFMISGVVCQDNGKDTLSSDVERSGIYVLSGGKGVVSGVATSNKDEDGTTGQRYGVRFASGSEVVYEGISSAGGTANGVSLISNGGEWPDITIASDALTLSNISQIQPRGESGLADDLSTINGQVSDHILLLRGNGTETITVKDAVGNINLAGGDFAMNSSADILALCRSAGQWYEISRSNNA